MSVRAGDEPLCGRFDTGEIVGLLRQPQQRQLAVGVARAEPGQRLAGPRERVGRRPAPRRHGGRCVPRGQDRSIATAPSTLRDLSRQPPLACVTAGLPTTVTSMLASSMRRADPLHVVHGHRVAPDRCACRCSRCRGPRAGSARAARRSWPRCRSATQRTLEERLRLGELLLGGPGLGEAPNFRFHDFERLAGAVGAGGGAGHEQRRVVERNQALNTE